MKFLHPLIMLVFFGFFVVQRKLGMRILGIKERSPEFLERPSLLAKHRSFGYGMLVFCFLGMLGGIFATHYLFNISTPFMQSYGHGFIGSIGWGLLLCSAVIGLNIKRVVKPKIRERFVLFHQGLFYLVAIFGGISLITGLFILHFGLQNLPK